MSEDFLKLNMEDYLPLRDVVFRTLRQAILKGDLKPGEYRKLTPKEIAELDRLTGSGGKDREG